MLAYWDVLLSAADSNKFLDVVAPGRKLRFDMLPKSPTTLYLGSPINTKRLKPRLLQQPQHQRRQARSPSPTYELMQLRKLQEMLRSKEQEAATLEAQLSKCKCDLSLADRCISDLKQQDTKWARDSCEKEHQIQQLQQQLHAAKKEASEKNVKLAQTERVLRQTRSQLGDPVEKCAKMMLEHLDTLPNDTEGIKKQKDFCKKLALCFHPDKNGAESSTEIFKHLQQHPHWRL